MRRAARSGRFRGSGQAVRHRAGPRKRATHSAGRPSTAASGTRSGGDLRNIVLAAVYDSAAQGGSLGMRHIVAAAVREHTKLGRRAPPGLWATPKRGRPVAAELAERQGGGAQCGVIDPAPR